MIDIVALLGDRKFEAHSSIVLTYALDLLLYDDFVRRQLRAAGAMNQIVFCDAQCYDREMGCVGATRHLGRSYSVTPVHQAGAFHPKIYLLLGSHRARLLVGSGNATLGGLTRNAELFGEFEFDDQEQAGPHPAFGVAMELIRSVAQNSSPLVRLQLDRALSRSTWMNAAPVSDGRQLLVGSPGRPPLLDQLRQALGPAPIDHALVCSASFDRQLHGLERLSELTEDGKVTCLVQPDRVRLDGNAVRRLRRKVDWKSLSLAHLRRKADSADTFSHAKLFVITAGKREFVAFGSANASSPALLGGDGANTETLVLLPPGKAGSLIDKLGLRESLESPSPYESLASQAWTADDEESATTELFLSSVSVDQGKISANFMSPPGAASLSLGIGPLPPNGPTKSVVTLERAPGSQWTAGWHGDSAARVAWVVNKHGMPISNPVAITWRDVAETLAGGGHGRKYDEAIAAMLDGQVLNTALYALLDSVCDFAQGAFKSADKEVPSEEAKTATPRTEESFYSDRVAVVGDGVHLSADRMDLDLLGSLVRPMATRVADDTDEGWESNEELERLQLDREQQAEGLVGPGNGSDSIGNTLDVSGQAIEKAARRLCRRLDRAASAAEDFLGLPLQDPVPAGDIARQLWMMHVAAFLAGREVVTNDGPASCLSPDAFAFYAIRMAHALAGGRKGALLARLPADAWSGHDGDSLKRGLAFAWTCVMWAATYLCRHWESVAEATEFADDIATAAPELVAARFIIAAAQHCSGPDEADLAKRLPAISLLSPSYREKVKGRLDRLVATIRRLETMTPETPKTRPPNSEPGELVYSAGLGVTVVARSVGDAIELIDLSRAVQPQAGHSRGKPPSAPPYLVTFRQMVIPMPSEGARDIIWRPPEELVVIWERAENRS